MFNIDRGIKLKLLIQPLLDLRPSLLRYSYNCHIKHWARNIDPERDPYERQLVRIRDMDYFFFSTTLARVSKSNHSALEYTYC